MTYGLRLSHAFAGSSYGGSSAIQMSPWRRSGSSVKGNLASGGRFLKKQRKVAYA